MTFRRPALVVAVMLLGPPVHSLEEMDSFPDSALTAHQWQQRVIDARRRSEEYVAMARSRTESSPTDDDAEAADQRAMNDPTLQRGDMIATSKGFFVFTRDDRDQRTPADFAPVIAPQRRPE